MSATPTSADLTPPDPTPRAALDDGDLALIDDLLARSPEERLEALEATLRSLETLRAATGSPAPAE